MKKILTILLLLAMTIGMRAQEYNVNPNEINGQGTLTAGNGGDFNIYLGCEHEELVKPFIIVEGIDPTNLNTANDAMNVIDEGPDFFLAEELMSAGFDIVTLNFADGTDNMAQNALVVQQLIQWLNTQVDNSLVIMGESMGGIVVRYALEAMEQANIDHNVSLYISFDSPHRGANIPLAFQNFADFWVDNLLPSLSIAGFSTLNIGLMALAPATRELAFPYFTNNPPHDAFYAILDGWGMPQDCRNIAIACGAGDGTQQATQPGVELFRWNDFTPPFLGFHNQGWAMPGNNLGVVFQGLYFGPNIIPIPTNILNIPRVNTEPGKPELDHVPGSHFNGYSTFTDGIDNLSDALLFVNAPDWNFNNNDIQWEIPFIPTVSALAVATNNYLMDLQNTANIPTIFDDIYFDETDNLEHLEMTAGIRDFVLDNAIVGEFFQNETENQDRFYFSPTFIRAGRNVTNNVPVGDYVVTGANTEVEMVARNRIILEEGFRTNNSDFHAWIDDADCPQEYEAINPNGRMKPPKSSVQKISMAEYREIIKQSGDSKDGISRGNNATVQLYPNPSDGIFTIDNPLNAQEFKILTLEGRVVYQGRLLAGKNNFNLLLEAGAYVVRTEAGESIKLMIVR